MEKIIIEVKEVREKQIKIESNLDSIDKNLQSLHIEFKDISKLLSQNMVFSEKLKNLEEDLKENRQREKEAIISIKDEIKEMKENYSKNKFAFISFVGTVVAGFILFFIKEGLGSK